jgi:hypothetical protein
MAKDIFTSPLVLVCALRYALGRQTYVVQEVAGALRANAPLMGGLTEAACRDIEEWLRLVEGTGHPRDLVEQWTTTLEALRPFR